MIKNLKRLLLTLAILIPSMLTIILLHFLMTLDLSMQPVYKASDEEIEKTRIHLISYADNKEIFFKNQNILAMSAVNRGIDFIYNYKRRDLDPDFVKKNKAILDDPYGAGWWLWKPYLILKTLESVPEGDVVFYADTGLLIRGPVKEYLLPFMTQKEKDIMLFAYDPKDYGLAGKCASRETFIKLGCDEESYRTGHHVWAGILVLRNSPKSRAFIKSWLTYCEDADLLQGKNLKATPHPEFTHHQHDEAILSVLGSRESDKVMYGSIRGDFHRYIHFHRRKSDETSLLGHSYYDFTRFERELLNQPVIRPLKKLVEWLPLRKVPKPA